MTNSPFGTLVYIHINGKKRFKSKNEILDKNNISTLRKDETFFQRRKNVVSGYLFDLANNFG